MYIEHYCDKCGGPLRLWIDNILDKDKPVEIEITPKPDRIDSKTITYMLCNKCARKVQKSLKEIIEG